MFTQLYRQSARIALLLVGMMTFLLASGVAAQPSAPPPPTNQIEFIGVVQTMTMDTLQINNQIINISRAQIKTPIQVGQPLKIEGRLLADGSIIAREVKAVEDDDDPVLPGEFEIVGILTGMDAATVTVGTQIIQIASAELYPGLALGSVIKVKASLDPASAQWTAREVRPADFDDDDNGNDNFDDNGNDNDDSDDDTFKLIGTLEEIGEGYIVIAGRRINTINARFSNRLVLGARVEVRLRASNGELVARRIRLVQRAGDDDRRNITLPANCTPVQPAGWTSYTVQPGDTLSSIAARSGSSLSDLIFFNCISNPRLLTAGAVLFVPRTPNPASFGNDNGNDNDDDNGNDNRDDRSNDNDDDNGNDNRDDRSNNNDDDRDNRSNDNNRGDDDDDDD